MLELLQQQFTTLIERRAFEPIRRFMTPVDQDDRLAEGIAMTWSLAARKAGLGIKMDNALLVHAVKLRALDHRRQLPRGGQPRRDALHLANFIDGKVVIHRLDGLVDEGGLHTGEGDTEVQASWLAATSLDPAEQLASAVDLQGWLGSLPAEDQALLAARYMGKTLTEIGSAAGMSTSATCTRLRALGGDLAARAGIRVQADAAGPSGASAALGGKRGLTQVLRRRPPASPPSPAGAGGSRRSTMKLWRAVRLPLLVEVALAVLTVIASQAKRRRPQR